MDDLILTRLANELGVEKINRIIAEVKLQQALQEIEVLKAKLQPIETGKVE